MKLDDDFETFVRNISLGRTPTERIDNATSSLTKHLRQHYGLSAADVFAQGSFPNGTAVEPADADGEYDVDLVCVCAAVDATPDQALSDLENKIAENATYKTMLEKAGSKRGPCVRLHYADDHIGSFHVDVVPVRTSSSADPQGKLEVPRRGEGWHDSAPREYTEWCSKQGPTFARTVKILKRWRGEHQGARSSVKSIVLQVLASEGFNGSGSDSEVLVRTLKAMQARLAASPVEVPIVSNPVLAKENLARRWSKTSYKNFRTVLDDAVELAQEALDETDRRRSHELWRELLGDDFPGPPKPPPPPKSGGRKPAPDGGRNYG